nr:MAG TPA: hypothetical protein [Caudoviricetes sp.]
MLLDALFRSKSLENPSTPITRRRILHRTAEHRC